MIEIEVPGGKHFELHFLVSDYNGTLAVDGHLCPGVRSPLLSLARLLEIHIVTADTFGCVRAELGEGPWHITVLPSGAQDRAKRRYLRRLGAPRAVTLGNGRNDRLMLGAAALSVGVLSAEGAHPRSLTAVDVVVPGPCEALELLLNPRRLTATLRR